MCRKGDEAEKSQWNEKGKGPLYLLRSNKTGKARVLMRLGNGRLVMNFEPLKGTEYKVTGAKGTTVSGAFVDHLASRESDKKLAPFMVLVKEGNDAQEIARILKAEQPK